MTSSPCGYSASANPAATSVVWTTPGGCSQGSVPLGNGDLGLNAWVEIDPMGRTWHVVFYIGKGDAWDESGRLLKLTKVRATFALVACTSEVAASPAFSQTLDLLRGELLVALRGAHDAGDFSARLWVDANAPLVRLESACSHAYTVAVTLEPWRLEDRVLEGRELDSGAYGLEGSSHLVVSRADRILTRSQLGGRQDVIGSLSRNEASAWSLVMEHQGLGAVADASCDPLLHRTTGCLVTGEGMSTRGSDQELTTGGPVTQQALTVAALTGIYANPEAWLADITALLADGGSHSAAAREAHVTWWEGFWDRSWIRVGGFEGAEIVTQGWVLQRYVNACAGRGQYPIKFNGSLFTVDNCVDGELYDADYRRWGGPYWFQNTRLTYWPMFGSGDYDLMAPFFRLYRSTLHVAYERSRAFFGHSGACFPETMTFWGSLAGSNYGWDRSGMAPGYIDNPWIRYHWSGAIELLVMGLDYWHHTADNTFLSDVVLPLADGVLEWYDQHYPKGTGGRMVIAPASALETQDAVNPMPEVAGLIRVLDDLLKLPGGLVGERRLADWARLLEAVPPLPIGCVDGPGGCGGAALLDAQELLGEPRNSENPSLYAVFPFALYTAGRPGLDMALRAWRARRFPGNAGWRQDPIQAAYLGLADEAGDMVLARFSEHHTGSRFPAFWGPNYDWVPDQDHGNVGVMALQAMLLQTDGGTIRLFPAWPLAWDVGFRLHAPGSTVVEGALRGGKLEWLAVSPAERRPDIVICGGVKHPDGWAPYVGPTPGAPGTA